MSFSLDFNATVADAHEIIKQEHAPQDVKNFLHQGLAAFAPDRLVHVKANGHLFNGDYQRSNGDLLVEAIDLRKPKPPA